MWDGTRNVMGKEYKLLKVAISESEFVFKINLCLYSYASF